jgi:cytoskeletal protein CcmA (bactofilin family)
MRNDRRGKTHFRRSHSRAVVGAVVLSIGVVAAWHPVALAGGKAGVSDAYHVREGETHDGDLYLFSGVTRIDGVQNGNVLALGKRLIVTGRVTGHVLSFAQSVELEGTIEDSVWAFGQDVEVTGTIDGNVSAYGQEIDIAPGALIRGSLKACGADVKIDGEILGDLEVIGAEVVLLGSVGGSAELEADIIEIAPEARVAGDLDYTSRNRLDLEEAGKVGGDIDYSRWSGKRDITFTSGGFYWRFTFAAFALIVGLAAVGLFHSRVTGIVATVGGDGLRSAGVGFITAVVTPVAMLLACILIITIPLVFIAALLFAVLVYLAKVPVAIWLGDWIMKRFGRTDSSPYLSLVIGIPVLYILFAVPFLGKIAWFGSLFIGLGAVVLTIWMERQEKSSSGDAAPSAPPVAPGYTEPSPTPSTS